MKNECVVLPGHLSEREMDTEFLIELAKFLVRSKKIGRVSLTLSLYPEYIHVILFRVISFLIPMNLNTR